MKQHDTYQGHLLVAGVAAIVASSVVAIAGLTLAQNDATTAPNGDASVGTAVSTTPTTGDAATTTAAQPANSTAWQGDQSYGTGGARPGDMGTGTAPWQPQPVDGTRCPNGIARDDGHGGFWCEYPTQQGENRQQWGGDRCSQIHSAAWGDRCAKERALIESQCVQDISPECKGGGPGQSGPQQWGNQQGWEQQQGNGIDICRYIRENGGRAVCIMPGTTAWNGDARYCSAKGLQMIGQDCPEYRGDQPSNQYHGAPDMGPRGYNMGQGGMQGGPGDRLGGRGMGGGMGPGMGGPGFGGPMGPGFGGDHMSCDRMDMMLEKMQEQLAKIDAKFEQTKAQMKKRVYGKVTKLQAKMEDALVDAETPEEEEKISAKYKKKIAKAQQVADKRYPLMMQSLDEKKAEAKERMQEGLTSMQKELDRCQEMEDEGGDDFGEEEWNGGGFEGGPGFGPGGPGGGFGPMPFGF